jgi:hypothetical protein
VAADVFPEAEWEHEAARQLKLGIRNADTELLLEQVFGIERHVTASGGGGAANVVATDGKDMEEEDDNVDEDGHFDMYSYQEERRIEREERKKEIKNADDNDDDDSHTDSTHSSQVTLVELSSVELNVGKDELAALTDIEDEESSENDDRPAIRQSRRLRGKLALSFENGDRNSSDPGKLNTSNIVLGKRKRKTVDYRKLNDAIFGDVSECELEKIDGGDDFVFTGTNALDDSADDGDDSGDSDDESGSVNAVNPNSDGDAQCASSTQ